MGFKHSTLEVFYTTASLHKICDENKGEDPTCSDKYNEVDWNVIDHIRYFGYDFAYDILEC